MKTSTTAVFLCSMILSATAFAGGGYYEEGPDGLVYALIGTAVLSVALLLMLRLLARAPDETPSDDAVETDADDDRSNE